MSDIRFKPFHTSSGYQAVEGTKYGEIFTMEWVQAHIARGNAFQIAVGAFSTPIVGGGNGTIIDLDQPEFLLSVPSGKAIFPFRVHAQVQPSSTAPTDADESEILFGVDRTQALTLATATAETAFNMRTDNIRSSTVTCSSAHTADITAPATPALGIELARAVKLAEVTTAAGYVQSQFELLYAPSSIPMLVGPCSLLGYWGGTLAVSGFAQVHWIELATADFPSS